MKLSYRRVAALEHFQEQLRREDLEVIGVDAIRQRIHGAAPGPEAVARRRSIFGIARHGALERVTVRIGHAGNDDPVDALGAGSSGSMSVWIAGLPARRAVVRRGIYLSDDALIGDADDRVPSPSPGQEH